MPSKSTLGRMVQVNSSRQGDLKSTNSHLNGGGNVYSASRIGDLGQDAMA